MPQTDIGPCPSIGVGCDIIVNIGFQPKMPKDTKPKTGSLVLMLDQFIRAEDEIEQPWMTLYSEIIL